MKINQKVKSVIFLLIRIILFILFACCYLYLGYHLRDYIIDFSTFSFVPHPGVIEADYVQGVTELSKIITPQSRWLTNIVITLLMIISISLLIYLIFLKIKYAIISVVFYIILIMFCVLFILIGNSVNSIDLGYHFARFVKDQLIHSPFVFILLVSCLKVFKV